MQILVPPVIKTKADIYIKNSAVAKIKTDPSITNIKRHAKQAVMKAKIMSEIGTANHNNLSVVANRAII